MIKSVLTIVCGSILLFSCQKKEEKETVTEDTTVQEVTETAPVTQACYHMVQGKDSIVLNIERSGDSIKGIFNWLPYEKDKKRSTFKGTVSGDNATTVAISQGEGMTNREELLFSFTDKEARVKFCEMTEGPNSIWKYKDLSKTTEQVLQKTDCK